MKELYPFVYRGLLTQESLDKAGRKASYKFGSEDSRLVNEKLSLEMLDGEAIASAQRMALVYTAVHAFENTVRDFVRSGMIELYKEEWWSKVPPKIQAKAKSRMEDEAKFRWHGARGGAEIDYCDFGDLSSIIVTQWDIFKDALVDLEWAKSLLAILERSRNIVMHGGVLAMQDIERIGGNIRDWVRQTG
jgi:Swt1-like HEPN